MQHSCSECIIFYSHQKIGSETDHIHMGWQKYSHTVLSYGYVISPAICHNIIQRHLNCLHVSQDITLFHCIKDIMLLVDELKAGHELVRWYELKVASILEGLSIQLGCRGWEINPLKIHDYLFSEISKHQVLAGVSVERLLSMDRSYFYISYMQRQWQPFFQTNFSRMFVKEIALEYKGSVSLHRKGQFCLLPSIIKRMPPPGTKLDCTVKHLGP